MSAAGDAAVSGAILFLVLLLLVQQLGYLSLSDPVTAVSFVVLVIVLGAVVCGVAVMGIARRARQATVLDEGPPSGN